MTVRPFLVLILVIILGALLRFYRVDFLTTFRSDQVIELTGAEQILHGHPVLIGIKTSNSEVRNGAVMYYPLALLLAVFPQNPLAGAALQTFLSLAAAVVVFLVGKRFFGNRTGLLAALFLSTSALLIKFSRQTLLAYYPLFFVSLSLLLLCCLVQNHRPRPVLLLGILCGFMLQIHYSTLAVLAAAGFFPWFFLLRRHVINYYLFLLAGFLPGFSPMILFEIRHELFNTKMFWQLIASGHSSPNGWNFGSFLLNSFARYFSGGNVVLGTILLLVLLFSTIFTLRRFSPQGRLLLFFLIFPVLFVLVLVRADNPHYLIVALPALVLLAAYVVSLLPKKLNIFLGLFFGLMFIAANFAALDFNSSSGWTMAPGWNLPAVRSAAGTIKQNSAATTYNVTMLIDGETQGLPLRYFLDKTAHPPQGTADYGSEEKLFVIAPAGVNPIGFHLWEIESLGHARIDQSWQINSGITLFALTRTVPEQTSR